MNCERGVINDERGEGAFKLRGFDKVRQRGELNWALQLPPSG